MEQREGAQFHIIGERSCGILLHPTSLPSRYGIGDLGPWSRHFVDFLSDAGQRYWQILPLGPTEPTHGNSPYHSISAFALNPLLLSPEVLANDGWLSKEDVDSVPGFSEGTAHYGEAAGLKERFAADAFLRFGDQGGDQGYQTFCGQNSFWLEDYALFSALKSLFQGKAWTQWPRELKHREAPALRVARNELRETIERIKFTQYLVRRQWDAMRSYCHEKGIKIMGDIPFYVVHDSADVWANPELFNLDPEKLPRSVAGVPPDYFSATGQLWGNPVYRWDILKQQGYEWWLSRIAYNLELFDLVRIDHFRGFVAYWEIPFGEQNAVKGRWVKAPAWDFFECLKKTLGTVPIIAEDLGFITEDVIETRKHFGFPGMKILLFAFGEDLPRNPYAPHNLERECVVYTGTHDNNTVRGWFEKEAGEGERQRVFKYLGRKIDADEVHREFMRLAMMSVADTAIFPMQDVLGLGEEARMNRPARQAGNWQWRLNPSQISPRVSENLGEMVEVYGRI